MKKYIALYLTLFLYSLVGVLSKLAGKQPLFSIPFFSLYLGVLMVLMLYAVLWQKILKIFPLTVAFCNKAIVIPLGMMWGNIIFQEKITVRMLLGAAIIIGGIIIVGGREDE